jgi:hypothetical protein
MDRISESGHREGSSSFLKKRTKKLLSITPSMGATRLASLLRVTNKSFLVLFFKKELLSQRRWA